VDLLDVVGSLELVEVWVTRDVRVGRGQDEWFNALLMKEAVM
jgi:hypothetical protein